MNNIKNINELRTELCNAYLWVKDDPRRASQVQEMSNAAGKIISTVKIQLEYAIARKEKPQIAFLDPS